MTKEENRTAEAVVSLIMQSDQALSWKLVLLGCVLLVPGRAEQLS